LFFFFFFKQKTAYEISARDWSSERVLFRSRVYAQAALGKVVVPGETYPSQRRFATGARAEATIGAGDATLRVETAMGSVNISTR